MRTLRGDAADWGVAEALLARIAYTVAGANWQRSGGKGPRPKPIEIPGVGGNQRKSRQERGADAAQRLRNLGLIPAAPGQRPGPIPDARQPSAVEFQQRVDDEFLAREMRRATDT